METSDRLQCRIQEFARQLREEFGPVAAAEHSCLLEAAEAWGVRIGDELARAAMQQELPTAGADHEEACCPKCRRLARWKGQRKRRIETRRGPIHVSEPEYHCPSCRRSFFPDDASFGDGA
jgi:hypothetical protein